MIQPTLDKYTRDWSKYNQALTREGIIFMRLLDEIASQVKRRRIRRRGRPHVNTKDIIFAMVLKLYTRMPARQLTSQLVLAKSMNYMKQVPHFNTVLNYLRFKTLTPILKELLTISSLPLKVIETRFAVDSTGFSTDQYKKWFHARSNKGIVKDFVKAHAMCGVLTNVVTSLEVTEGYSGDSPEFPKLVSKTSENFKISEVSADKAYSARSNLDLVSKLGAYPYIPFRRRASKKSRGSLVWKRMLTLFLEEGKKFYKHYHLRSNIESTFSAIKGRFGSRLYTRNIVSQRNELYLKCICYNLVVLVKGLFELDLRVDLNKCASQLNENKLVIS